MTANSDKVPESDKVTDMIDTIANGDELFKKYILSTLSSIMTANDTPLNIPLDIGKISYMPKIPESMLEDVWKKYG